MSIAAEKISPTALYDMIEIFGAQPWIRHQPEEIAELWNICENREEQELLKILIMKFVVFDSDSERLACTAIAKQIVKWDLQPETTWIVAVANAGEIDGSHVGMQKLKNKIDPIEKWQTRFIANIPEASKKILKNQSVVLFDDFIGSGEKFIKKTNWLKRFLRPEIIESTKFYYLSFSGMQFGIDHLSKNTGCETFSYLHLKKAISEEFDTEIAEKYRQIMVSIESKLAQRFNNKSLEKFSFGFNSSEALYCGENDNCPNNVFPIFWWAKLRNELPFKTIFKRAG